MMSCLIGNLILSAALAGAPDSSAAPSVEVTTLAGSRSTGQLVELSADQVSLKLAMGQVKVPLSEVLDLRSLRAKAALPVDARRPDLALTDGSRLYWTAVRAEERRVTVQTPHFGNVDFPAESVSNIRLALLDPQAAESWKELCARKLKRDMVVISNGNVLDHLDGTVGAIDDRSIRFTLEKEKDEVKLDRTKVFGVIYARLNADAGKAICEFTSTGGDFVKAQSVAWADGRLKIAALGGTRLDVPADQMLALDFSLGKVRYLSQLEPRDVKYTPFFDQVWPYCRDRPRDGGLLRLGNKEYSRGLWIHSRTLMKYRLGGDFRRFQAVMGIDQAVAPLGNVHVVISGDGRTLREADVRGSDPPQNLDLDVSGVRELEILVDFGGDLDIADHLDLADAKVIK